MHTADDSKVGRRGDSDVSIFIANIGDWEADLSQVLKKVPEHLQGKIPGDANHASIRPRVAGRALLALGMKNIVGSNPWTLRTQERGKPYVEMDGGRTVHASISHAGAWVMVALSTRYEVGIDVETQRRLPELEGMVQLVATPLEKRLILQSDDREKAFLRIWTRKGALFKALGTGVNDLLNHVDVSTGKVVLPPCCGSGIAHLVDLAWHEAHPAALCVIGANAPTVAIMHHTL